MKKIVALVILMVMSLTVMAHGEVYARYFGEELVDDQYVPYVKYVSDSGEEVKIHVTEEEWVRLFAERLEADEMEKDEESRAEMWEDIGRIANMFVFWS